MIYYPTEVDFSKNEASLARVKEEYERMQDTVPPLNEAETKKFEAILDDANAHLISAYHQRIPVKNLMSEQTR